MAEAGRERKRRKWDVAAPQGVPTAALGGSLTTPPFAASGAAVQQPQQSGNTSTADIIARAKQGALSVLDKINQDLRAQGKAAVKMGKLDEDRIMREVTINDAPGPIRYNLTRRAVQDDIARRTGTQVVVRGCYQPRGSAPNLHEAPLYLKITPGLVASENDHVQKKAVDRAAAEVEHMLRGGQLGTYQESAAYQGLPSGGQQAKPPNSHPLLHQQFRPQYSQGPPPRGPPQGNMYPPGQAGYQAPLPNTAPQNPVPPSAVPLHIGIDAPPEFNLALRLRGEGNTFLQHIANATRSQVVLRGRGSGMVETQEPLHILVTGGNQNDIDEAVRLAKSLIDTVRETYKSTYPYQQQSANSPIPPGAYSPAATAPVHQAMPPPYQQAPAASSYPAYAGYYGPPGQPPLPYSQPQPGYYAPPGNQPQVPMNVRPPGPQRYAPPAYQGYGGPQAPVQQPMPPHSYQGPAPPPSQGFQEQQHAPYAAMPPPTAASPPAAEEFGKGRGDAGGGSAEEAQKERKRRFKEVKDTPPPVPAKPAPYAPQPMGPPPPRTPQASTAMGPPPPRPPRAVPGGSGNSNPTNVSGSLAGLVDYD